MKRYAIVLVLLCLGMSSFGAVVINEIHYNPDDRGLEDGSNREFIELYNSGTSRVTLTGARFTRGIDYTFPANTSISAKGYLILARVPTHTSWRNRTVLGPFTGKLSNSGDTLTLVDAQGQEIDSVRYLDQAPWPQAPDGYKSSLERISADLPSNDYRSWRGSLTEEGTPGQVNSVAGTVSRPVILGYELNPPHPTSMDSVTVKVNLDAPEKIDTVELRWESTPTKSDALIQAADDWKYRKGTTAPSPGLEWTQPAFDDSAWATGKGGFGYGDLDQVKTPLNDMQNRYTTVFLRKKFQVGDPSTMSNLTLELYVDDGFVCYMNGKRVAEFLAPEIITAESVATGSHESDSLSSFNLGLAKDLLVAGENTLALVGMNNTASSTDFVLAPTLKTQVATSARMESLGGGDDYALYQAVIPSVASQTLMRCRVQVRLKTGETVLLPHEAEPDPFLSYFVYNGEIPSKLPLLWIYPSTPSALLPTSRRVAGVVYQATDASSPIVYDGAGVESAHQGLKVRFLKGDEFFGDRTLNVIEEIPAGGTNAGPSSPLREHLGYWLYRQMGVLSPWAEFFRTITVYPGSKPYHEQRLVVEQVNEALLARNGLDPDGDLYKRVYTNPPWEKHTNKDTGTESIDSLERDMQNTGTRDRTIQEKLNRDEFLAFSVTSVFTSNWDGFWNNNWMYLSPETGARWVIIPWDLDWLWGSTTNGMYAEMPLSFPIDGNAIGNSAASRSPGPITSPLHRNNEFQQEYIVRLRRELTRRMSVDTLFGKMDATEAILLQDLQQLEAYTKIPRSGRADQIKSSDKDIKTFITKRHEYLNRVLPASVEEWMVQ